MIKKVGKSIIKGKKERIFTYEDVDYDKNGWADATRFMPADYDLVYMKIEGKGRICGWSYGNRWDGLKYQKDDKVLMWKEDRENDLNVKSFL